MTIYKLEDICEIINGKDLHANMPLDKILTNEKTEMIYVKTSCFSNGYQKEPSFWVREKYVNDKNVPKLVLSKGDLIISKAINIGEVSEILYDNTAIYRALTHLKPNEEIVNKKFLKYYMNSRLDDFSLLGNGSTIKTIPLNILSSIEISLPSLVDQNKIIDIIEPIEELYLKYSNVVDISNIENTKNDIKKIIDIIEPIENLVNMSKYTLENLLNVIKGLKIKNNTVFLKDITTPTQNKPKNIIQVSAKVMNKRNPIINKFEDKGTYGTNTFNCEKGTLLINTIRTYLNKFAILPSEADVNGTSIQLKVDNNFETSILHALLNDNFWSKTELLSQGTKMPVIKKSDILDIEINVVENNINNVFDVVINLNNMIIRLEEMKEKILKILIK